MLDAQTLRDYNVQKESTIHMTLPHFIQADEDYRQRKVQLITGRKAPLTVGDRMIMRREGLGNLVQGNLNSQGKDWQADKEGEEVVWWSSDDGKYNDCWKEVIPCAGWEEYRTVCSTRGRLNSFKAS